TLFNPAAESIFQRPPAEVLHQSVQYLFAQSDWPKYKDYLSRQLGRKPTEVMEADALRADGSALPIDLAVSEITRGGLTMLIIIVRDISERKRLEDKYRQSQKMEAVGRLAGGIAHDFNNLMQAILGYVNLLDRRLAPGDPSHETVDYIQKSLAHASSLTRQLLAFSRKQVLKPKLLALNSVVAEMTHLLQRVLGETIQLKLKLAEPVPCVRADPGQMEQLILNLAINARDAMPQGGVLSITTSHVTLTEPGGVACAYLSPGSYALLRVADTGCGMTPEVQAHLFEPFFTTKDIGKGTGLGLSNVYGVVKQSGGEIAVTSTPGRGSVFDIYLPRLEGLPGEEESTHLLPVRGGGGHETVLLVEDEELVRLMLVDVLKAGGYNVLNARHGNDALAVAGQYQDPIDLLVTDMTMPGFSGLELARRLGEKRPSMRVLFISGYSDQAASQWSNLNQPVEFLQKPFHPDTLMSKARHILDHRPK
ncbi:MAG TPA: ATP-binding protein, partial [Candidatus Cybelea sp.]|nr:ATP-binding protein [Candidatus Cybelea sp.]